MERIIIGLVGHPSCGKDTVADYLVKKYGFVHISFGDLIRKYITGNKLGDLSRDNLFKIGNELRTKNGPDILAKMALATPADKLVLSGCRAIAEAQTPKDAGAKIIFITAPVEVRYERALARGRIGENISLEKFKEAEDREMFSSNPVAPNVNAVTALADYTIINSGTLQDLYKKVDEVLPQVYN